MKFIHKAQISLCDHWFVGLRPVIRILCHVLARGWRRWLRYFTEAKAESQRPNSRAKTWHKNWMTGLNPNYDTIPIPSLQSSQNKRQNPRLLTIAGAIWFCSFRQCTPSQRWMHAPVAKEHRLMTSQYPIFDRTDNLNPQWMEAVNR